MTTLRMTLPDAATRDGMLETGVMAGMEPSYAPLDALLREKDESEGGEEGGPV